MTAANPAAAAAPRGPAPSPRQSHHGPRCPSCQAETDDAAARGLERLPKSILAILTKTLDKQPQARFQTAGQVAEALRQVRAGRLAPAAHSRDAEPRPAPALSASEPRPERRERRSETRIETPLNTVLRRFDASGVLLQEERTIVDNISRKGARVLTATRQVGVGSLVELEEVDGDFRARATVRNCHTGGDGIPRLGLRFEGQSAPDRLVQTDDRRQMIHATRPPAPRPPALAASLSRPPAAAGEPRRERRKASRLEAPLEVWLKPLSANGAVTGKERTIAENIGRGGARVMTALSDLNVGDALIFEEAGGDFQTRAAIRHAYIGADRIRRLSLQFLETFPPTRLAPPDDLQAATTSAALPGRASALHPGRGPSLPLASRNPCSPRAGSPASGEASDEDRLGSAGPEAKAEAGAETARAGAMPAAADEPKDSDTERRSRIASAEKTLTSARQLMRKEQYWDVIKTIEPALRDVQDIRMMKRGMRILLAQATMQNPKWRKHAEAILHEVLEEDPADVDGHFELAKLYQANDLAARAQRELRRVLEIDPAHVGAVEALGEAPAKHRWFQLV
jgi:hypothetical protein